MAKRTKKDLDTKTSSGAQADAYAQTQSNAARPTGTARVIAAPLSRILPDPTQARVILPPDLYFDFYFPTEDRAPLDCYQVAGVLLESAEHDKGMRQQVDSLIMLGNSILQHGQIEPTTGYRARDAAGEEFIRLLVGERRFWSLAILAVQMGLESEPTLDLILKEGYSIGEQLAENLQRDDLTAVDLAKGVASLLLAELDQPLQADEADYLERCRKVLGIRKMPDGLWEKVQQQVPFSRQHLKRLLNILRLPDDLLYVAAISKLPETVLREILDAKPERWPELVNAAATDNYTAAEVQEAVDHQKAPNKKKKTNQGRISVHQKAASRTLSLIRLTDQREFDGDYAEVAGLISAGYEVPADVSEIGKRLVMLGKAVQKAAERRSQ